MGNINNNIPIIEMRNIKKNFGAVQPGLIMRSASLQLWWMGLLFNHMVKGNISIRNALTSLPEIPMGAREGYRMGKQLLK